MQSNGTLGNGAKVIYRKADFEKDQVNLSSFLVRVERQSCLTNMLSLPLFLARLSKVTALAITMPLP